MLRKASKGFGVVQRGKFDEEEDSDGGKPVQVGEAEPVGFVWEAKAEFDRARGAAYVPTNDPARRAALTAELDEERKKRAERQAVRALMQNKRLEQKATEGAAHAHSGTPAFDALATAQRAEIRSREGRATPVDRVIAFSYGCVDARPHVLELSASSFAVAKAAAADLERLVRHGPVAAARPFLAAAKRLFEEPARQHAARAVSGGKDPLLTVRKALLKRWEGKTAAELQRMGKDLDAEAARGGDADYWAATRQELAAAEAAALYVEWRPPPPQPPPPGEAPRVVAPAAFAAAGAALTSAAPLPAPPLPELIPADDPRAHARETRVVADRFALLRAARAARTAKMAERCGSNFVRAAAAAAAAEEDDVLRTSAGMGSAAAAEARGEGRGGGGGVPRAPAQPEGVSLQPMGAGEVVELRESYAWASAHVVPRKPRVENWVHARVTWNIYNLRHYDRLNPPPAQICGYRFAVHYPSLQDPKCIPRFQLLPAAGGWLADTCILRFSAGPPYEDVAYRILNRTWNTSPRRGFRAQWSSGVLFLNVFFVQDFYRR